MSPAMAPTEYLKRPYGRVVVPEADGTFRAEIMEFPGCLATGETPAEALANIEGVARGWLEATLAKGLEIPEPMEVGSHSGKLVTRLGPDLHRRSAYMAAVEGVSLNQFIVTAVAERVGTCARRSLTTYAQPSLCAQFTVQVTPGENMQQAGTWDQGVPTRAGWQQR